MGLIYYSMIRGEGGRETADREMIVKNFDVILHHVLFLIRMKNLEYLTNIQCLNASNGVIGFNVEPQDEINCINLLYSNVLIMFVRVPCP